MSAVLKIVRAICVVNGACATAFGLIMMAGSFGGTLAIPAAALGLQEMVPLVRTMPLPGFMTQDLFWPGLALLLVNGVANIVAAVLFARRDWRASAWALVAGVLLMCWCAFETLYFPNAASTAYLALGVAQTIGALLLIRTRAFDAGRERVERSGWHEEQ